MLRNKRIVLFSYGSGLASAMFSVRVSGEASADSRLEAIITCLRQHRDVLEHSRVQVEPQLYDRYLADREKFNKTVPRRSSFGADSLRPGTWYLKAVDERYRRTYDRVPASADGRFDLVLAAANLKKHLLQLS